MNFDLNKYLHDPVYPNSVLVLNTVLLVNKLHSQSVLCSGAGSLEITFLRLPFLGVLDKVCIGPMLSQEI